MLFRSGKLKDKGLKIAVLKETFQEISFLKDEEAMKEAYRVLGNDYPSMEVLLKQAGTIAEEFFNDKILDHLIVGVD